MKYKLGGPALLLACLLLALTGFGTDSREEILTSENPGNAYYRSMVQSSSKLPVGEEINWQVISSGGAMNATAGAYVLSGTVGQTAVGKGISDPNALYHGFWQSFGTGNCCLDWGTPGDANSDHNVNLIDILFLISYKYDDPPGPSNPDDCDELMDANGDHAVNLIDILYLISYKYDDPPGPEPVCPM